MTLMSLAKRCGSSWKTDPLHMPKAPDATKKAAPQIGREGGDDQRDDRDAVENAERADATEFVGEGAAHGTAESADERAEGGHFAGVNGLQVELVAEVDREGGGETDETAEADRVEEAEPVGVFLAEELGVVGEFFLFEFAGRFFRKNHVEHESERERDEGGAEDGLPAPGGGDAGGGEVIDDNTDVARAGEAEHDTLHVRRIPAAGLRERDGEAGSGDT
jgi:hypothetical protein